MECTEARHQTQRPVGIIIIRWLNRARIKFRVLEKYENKTHKLCEIIILI